MSADAKVVFVKCEASGPWCDAIVSDGGKCITCEKPVCPTHTSKATTKWKVCCLCSSTCDVCGEVGLKSQITRVTEGNSPFGDSRFRCVGCARTLVQLLNTAIAAAASS